MYNNNMKLKKEILGVEEEEKNEGKGVRNNQGRAKNY